MRMSVFFAMAAALMMSFLQPRTANAEPRMGSNSWCYEAEDMLSQAYGKKADIKNEIQSLTSQMEAQEQCGRQLYDTAVLGAGDCHENAQALSEQITQKQADLDKLTRDIEPAVDCKADLCPRIDKCLAATKKTKKVCEAPDKKGASDDFSKNMNKIMHDQMAGIEGGEAGFACSRDALTRTKTAFEKERDRAVRACQDEVDACERSCMEAPMAASGDGGACGGTGEVVSAVRAPLARGAGKSLDNCRDYKRVADQIKDVANEQIALLDQKINALASTTGDGGSTVCKKEPPKPDTVTPTRTEDEPPSKNGPAKAASSPDSSGDNKEKKDAKKNDSGMGNLASMLGPLMGALAGNQTPTTPTATTPAVTNGEDCSLAQNANNVTCICASNPRSAGCQLALNGQGTNPVTFSAGSGSGGANLTKDTTSTPNGADFAAQQMQMPPIQPDRGGGGGGGGGFVGGGGSSIGGGGLGGGGNGGDDGQRGGQRMVTSAQILSGVTGGSGFGGNRGNGMAFVDRDSDGPRGYRPRAYGKDEVLSQTKPDMRAFVPIDQRLIRQTSAERTIAGAEDATYLHPAHTNIFNVMHNRYEELINPLDENGN